MLPDRIPELRSRLDAIYRGTLIPTVEPTSIGEDGLPHTADGVLHSVEQHWLGAEGAMLVGRHIKDGVLSLERPGLSLTVRARTPDGIACPIVWGVSVERGSGNEIDDIVEPHLLAPEGKEVIITINGPETNRLALLGIYDQENPQVGMPPTRRPLHEENGRVKMYVGREAGNVPVVFWKDGKWGYLRVITPVKNVGGDLTTIEEGAPEVALHGGLYLITIPELTPPPLPEIKNILPDYGLRGGNLLSYGTRGEGITQRGAFEGDIMNSGVTMGGDELLKRLGLSGGRVGGLTQGEIRGKGGMTEFNPNTQNIAPFILRIRATGDLPSYLNPASVAVNTEPSITVKGAICAHCGMSAPKEAYSWRGNEFNFGQFDCGRCGSGTLEPVVYHRRIPKS